MLFVKQNCLFVFVRTKIIQGFELGNRCGQGFVCECVFAQPAFHGRRQLVGPDGKAQKDQIVVGQVDLVGLQRLGAVLIIVQSQQVVGRALQGHQRGGVALGAFFLGVPLAIPIGVITFFAAFVPILGALTSGVIAVLVAAVNGGLTKAIIMLVIILVVQQTESNILQPFMMSNAVSLHPVAVMLAITAGSAVAGIAGAVFSVPIAAFINATVMYLHGHDPMPELATAEDRPGGPPGMLDKVIATSYAGKPDTRPYVAHVETDGGRGRGRVGRGSAGE